MTKFGTIYTVYADKDDMTFIMKENEGSLECVGWYFGTPDEEMTKCYIGKLSAEFVE